MTEDEKLAAQAGIYARYVPILEPPTWWQRVRGKIRALFGSRNPCGVVQYQIDRE